MFVRASTTFSLSDFLRTASNYERVWGYCPLPVFMVGIFPHNNIIIGLPPCWPMANSRAIALYYKGAGALPPSSSFLPSLLGYQRNIIPIRREQAKTLHPMEVGRSGVSITTRRVGDPRSKQTSRAPNSPTGRISNAHFCTYVWRSKSCNRDPPYLLLG